MVAGSCRGRGAEVTWPSRADIGHEPCSKARNQYLSCTTTGGRYWDRTRAFQPTVLDGVGLNLTTVKRLLNAPHREQIAAAAARENQAMAELIGTGANADALTSFLQR